MTIEYDIQEDQPEGTDVFSLEPSSVSLIEKLVRHRFREISSVDARGSPKLREVMPGLQ